MCVCGLKKTKGQRISRPSISVVFQCQEKGNAGTDMEHLKDARDLLILSHGSFLKTLDVSCGKQYFVTLEQGSCAFKEARSAVCLSLICTISTCSLYDDPEPPCLILGS